MRFAILLVLTMACSHNGVWRAGTPGSPAIDCAAGDRVCERIASDLESVRQTIGSRGWTCSERVALVDHTRRAISCATLKAELDVLDQGEIALPHLVRAFDDRDDQVASFAMHLAAELDGIDAIVRWCDDARDVVRLKRCEAIEIERNVDPNELSPSDTARYSAAI